jgi:hypothetical protein
MIIHPLQNGHYLIKSFIDGRGLKLDIHKRCEFSKEEDDSSFWWDIEYQNGHYFFTSACNLRDYAGNVLACTGRFKRCEAENKNKEEMQKMIVHEIVLKPPYIEIPQQ